MVFSLTGVVRGNRGYWLNGVPEVAMVTDITRTDSNGLGFPGAQKGGGSCRHGDQTNRSGRGSHGYRH